MAGTGTLWAAAPVWPAAGVAEATIVGATGAGFDCGAVAGWLAEGRGPRSAEAVAVVAGEDDVLSLIHI